jgi:hypothetical protein
MLLQLEDVAVPRLQAIALSNPTRLMQLKDANRMSTKDPPRDTLASASNPAMLLQLENVIKIRRLFLFKMICASVLKIDPNRSTDVRRALGFAVPSV